MFEELAVEASAWTAQSIADENAANVSSFTSFVPGRNGHRARASGMNIDLTSTGSVNGHAEKSDEE